MLYIQFSQSHPLTRTMIQRYIQLINNALRNQNNETRSRAEAELIEQREKNPIVFFDICGQLLGNNTYDAFIRQSAGTIISRSVVGKTPNQEFYWDFLPPQVKQNVKRNILNTLMDPNIVVMKAGATVISSIVFVEVPRGQWANIIDILAQNTQNQQFAVKNASITTIGFICQQFSYGSVRLNQRVCQQLLGGIIVGIRSTQSKQLVETSLTALRNSINFLTHLLQNTNIRNQVFNVLYNFINDENLSNTAYQGMFEFSRTCYNFLGDYFARIKEFLAFHIKEKNQNTILALQLIDTIGTEYMDRLQEQREDRYADHKLEINNYLPHMQDELLPGVMRCLLIETKDDLDFSELRNSASKTLGTMISCGNRQAVDTVIQGVAHVVKSENVGEQQASAILLSALCEYNPEDLAYAENYVNDAFEAVLGLLASNQEIVIRNTLVGFIQIAEAFGHMFYNRQLAPEIFQKLFQIYKNSNIENIKTWILKIFFNITEKFSDGENILLNSPDLLLTKLVNEYEYLLENHYGLNIDLCGRVSDIIINFLVKLENRQTITHMIEFLLEKYAFYNDPNNMAIRKYSRNDLEAISLSIMSLINTSVLALEKYLPQETLLHSITPAVDRHLQNYGVGAEVIDVIGALAQTFKLTFERKGEQYWSTILHALQMINIQKCFTAALHCIGDYSRIYSANFVSKLNEILTKLLDLIHKDIEKHLKISIISCIGDMVIGLGPLCEPFIPYIINICELCFGAVYQLSQNPSEKEYIERLKSNLIEMYTCVVFAIMSSNNSKQINTHLASHFNKLVMFVIKTCNRHQKPQIEYLKNCLYLLFDEVGYFSEEPTLIPMLKQMMNSAQIQEYIKALEGYKDRQEIQVLQKHIENRYNLLKKVR